MKLGQWFLQAILMARLNNHEGVFQPKWFFYSVKMKLKETIKASVKKKL